MDNKHKPLPKWTDKLFRLIYEHWSYHAPCEHIDIQAIRDKEGRIWHIKTAPVFQEVFGGGEDGKKVWAGFSFDITGFMQSPDIWIERVAISSYCQECNDSPGITAYGKFRGHEFYLSVLLEPVAETDPVEVIDTLQKKIRDMPDVD